MQKYINKSKDSILYVLIDLLLERNNKSITNYTASFIQEYLFNKSFYK